MTEASSNNAARWPSYVGLGGIGITMAGVLMATGAWKQRTDDLDRRVTKVENIQQTNLPLFWAMQADLKYLADRARRDDRPADGDRRERR